MQLYQNWNKFMDVHAEPMLETKVKLSLIPATPLKNSLWMYMQNLCRRPKLNSV